MKKVRFVVLCSFVFLFFTQGFLSAETYTLVGADGKPVKGKKNNADGTCTFQDVSIVEGSTVVTYNVQASVGELPTENECEKKIPDLITNANNGTPPPYAVPVETVIVTKFTILCPEVGEDKSFDMGHFVVTVTDPDLDLDLTKVKLVDRNLVLDDFKNVKIYDEEGKLVSSPTLAVDWTMVDKILTGQTFGHQNTIVRVDFDKLGQRI